MSGKAERAAGEPLDLSANVTGDAWQVSTNVIGLGEGTRNLAHDAVVAMELQLLGKGWPTGAPLGTLPEVRKSLDLGRPACREAMTILEARGLVDIRCGPGGGLFVSAPMLEDVAGAVLMYLAASGKTQDSILDFRLIVWRMIVDAAFRRPELAVAMPAETGEWGFAVDLAERVGNPAMALAARLAEMLVRACNGSAAPGDDDALASALAAGSAERARDRLEQLAGTRDLAEPLTALEAFEHSLSRAGRKSAMTLAARMTRDLVRDPGVLESEWETALRLGYTGDVVRQARRILQDFDMVRCQRGRKGASWEAPAGPSGIIRLLAPCLAGVGTSEDDNAEMARYLACSAPALAARRADRRQIVANMRAPEANASELAEMMRMENGLLEASGNPLLAIFVRSLALVDACAKRRPMIAPSPSVIAGFNDRLLDAIEAGDAAAAEALALGKAQALAGWAEPDLPPA